MPATSLTTTKKTPVRITIRDTRSFVLATNNETMFKTNVAVITTSSDLAALQRTLRDTPRPFAVCVLMPKE